MLLNHGYRCHTLHKACSIFYRHSELIVKYNIYFKKTFLQHGISDPVFYVDLVYKFAGDVPRPLPMVYFSACSICKSVFYHFNNRNLFLTAELPKQGYRYHKIRKVFSKFYHRHLELIVK